MRTALPDFILNAPELYFGLELYWNAFWDLDSDRSLGFGPGQIPWTAMRDYAEAHEFDEEQVSSLFYLVKVLDDAFLKYHAEQAKKKGK